MKCNEFVKLIPDILNNDIEDDKLGEIIEHIKDCNDCYDELEIYFVLEKGFNDSNQEKDGNYVEMLRKMIADMEGRNKKYDRIKALYQFVQITANTCIIGVIIYLLFTYVFK